MSRDNGARPSVPVPPALPCDVVGQDPTTAGPGFWMRLAGHWKILTLIGAMVGSGAVAATWVASHFATQDDVVQHETAPMHAGTVVEIRNVRDRLVVVEQSAQATEHRLDRFELKLDWQNQVLYQLAKEAGVRSAAPPEGITP